MEKKSRVGGEIKPNFSLSHKPGYHLDASISVHMASRIPCHSHHPPGDGLQLSLSPLNAGWCLKLLLSAVTPCVQPIQMFWDVKWGFKWPGFDILALPHTCCMPVDKYWVSSLPPFLGCEINNSATIMCIHPYTCKSWYTIKVQQLLTIMCLCQHHHYYWV